MFGVFINFHVNLIFRKKYFKDLQYSTDFTHYLTKIEEQYIKIFIIKYESCQSDEPF